MPPKQETFYTITAARASDLEHFFAGSIAVGAGEQSRSRRRECGGGCGGVGKERAGVSVGGEQSGHIILREFSGTGDGLLTALYLTSVLKNSGKRISELADNKVFPQVNLTIECADNKKVVADADVQEAARQVSKRLEGKGRLLLRASGTEPKIRIMTECDSYETGKAEAEWLKSFIEQKLGLKK